MCVCVCVCVCVCITESLCCAAEINSTLKIIPSSMKFLEKKKSAHSSPLSLFLSFWLLLLVFSAENAGSPPASAQSILYFKTFFILEYSWLIIFWVSGGQESDSIICIPVSWSQRYPSHPGCHITEWNSPCYTLTHCRLSILNRAVPTTHSWRLNSGTLGSFLQPALTLFDHSRIGWVTYSRPPSPPVSP